jgi:DNA polymerase-3 subunit alpha
VARVDARKLNKGVLEALIQCGALDTSLQERSLTRARAFAAVDVAMERSRQATRDRTVGQTSLFGLFDSSKPTGAPNMDSYPASAAEWDQLELLAREKAALGCYVSGHPLHRYGAKLARIGSAGAENLQSAEPWSVVTMGGIVEGYQEKVFKSGGGKAAFFELEDMTGRVKAKLRGDRVETYGHILTSGEPVLVTGKVSFPMSEEASEELEPTLLVDEVVPLSDAIRSATRSVRLRLDALEHGSQRFPALKDVLQSHTGACPVDMVLSLPGGAEAQLQLDGTKIDPGDAVLSALERLFGGYVAELR